MKETIKKAQELLSEKSEWRGRYEGYAENIHDNKGVIKSSRRRFNEFPPLYFYISTTAATKANTSLLLDVRYRGQSVATLKANADSITLFTKKKDSNNKRDFNCDIELDNNPWDDTPVTEFRRFFRDRENSRNKTSKNKRNEEHNVEHLLLTEFSKVKSINKAITGIQPVKICGNRFGMPTPLRASKHEELKYSSQHGGGIDILARTGNGHATYLTVIEVKDENKPKEPPKDALKQAIQYAVFIRELLRSDSGKQWYELFGFNGSIPQNLTIRAVCAMPDDIPDKSFAKEIYEIENDRIECHYIYFKYDGKELSDFQSSL